MPMPMPMPMPMISKQQVLAAVMTATHTRHDQGREGLAGPIVLHLLMQASAQSRGTDRRWGGAPLEEAVDQLVGTWLRAMATDQPAAPQPAASTPPRPRRKRNDRPDPN
jgi:hypothetical protein